MSSEKYIRHDGKRRVVITGGGMLSALGDDWQEAFATLKSRKNCIVYMKDWDVFPLMNTRLACPYTKNLPSYPRKKIRGMGRVALLSLVATDKALKSAGLMTEEGVVSGELQNGRTGIAYGSCMGSMDSIVSLYAMIENHDTSNID